MTFRGEESEESEEEEEEEEVSELLLAAGILIWVHGLIMFLR